MLGHLEESVLIAVLELEKSNLPAFGLSIFDKLQLKNPKLVNGSVYSSLDRLETKGLLRSEPSNPTAKKGGRRKRLYFLENAALEKLQQSLLEKKLSISNLEKTLPNLPNG